MRTYITLSKSGHYTVSIRDGGKLLYRERKLASLLSARAAAKKFLETVSFDLCNCMKEDPKDGLGERVVIHSLRCKRHPDYGMAAEIP